LVTELFCRFGVCRQIHSDQGSEFESELFAAVCNKLGIEKTRTTPYRPQSDGLVERVNRVLQDMLAMFLNNFRNDWDDHLPYLLMAYRATVHESTGFSPFKMMFGREMNCPLDKIAGRPPDFEPPRCPVEYVNWFQFSLDQTFYFAKQNLRKAANRQKRNHDKNLKPRAFENGNFV
jgi:hypothetical protein